MNILKPYLEPVIRRQQTGRKWRMMVFWWSAIALARTEFQDPCIATLSLGISLTQVVKHLGNHPLIRHEG